MPRTVPRSIPKDIQAGLFFALSGAAFAAVASGYPQGTAARMGPGWFPLVLGLVLVALGGLVALSGAIRARRETGATAAPAGPVGWRPLLHVTVSVVAFALLIEPAGLVAASVALVLLSASGGWEFHWGEATALAGSLAALVVGLFAYALQIPLQVWPV